MPRWFVQRDYLGVLGGTKYALDMGAYLDLPEQAAAMVNADQSGTLAEVGGAMATAEDGAGEELTAEQFGERALDAPPSDRMKRAPGRKRGAKP